MPITPCRLCGYDAPRIPGAPNAQNAPNAAECPHCRLEPADASLARGALRARGSFGTVWDGVRAFPAALALLQRTPRALRLLVPPVALTGVLFVLLFTGLYGAIDAAFDAAATSAGTGVEGSAGWFASAVRWTLENPVMGFFAGLGRWVFFLLAAYLLAVWTFSLVYELVAGPFLDEIQARIEARWFGSDPRANLAPAGSRPRRLLGWIRAESSALFVSLEAALFTGVLLVLFFWVKFIPAVGVPLFFAIAGFATAVGLLDIPFSRRRWSLGQRLRFVRHHIAPVTAFGLTASALFVFLPLVGLLVTVPLASIGGLWLVCRLDKSFLRA